ncbi:hypothetical protein OG357_19095 [Streptomyces sp. NBC_01255]|uniref:hypothetical protein n=1 Tax=Streptomyces sp. NBC_01255 TaxID=2903798 RepID=UPI002E33B50E|nr:hypothetical protein [Streptomyces sp. NBC_01255]
MQILLGITVVVVVCAAFMGHGAVALAVVATALLTVVAEELVRTVMRGWLRTV